jgi:AcrR family transcriptional regulator
VAFGDMFSVESGASNQQIRVEPIQQRSAARLSALLDAAAEVVDEVGFDRITTAMVAERAGASIGTVYRYYPDRVAVLNALRDRADQRFRERVILELDISEPETWWDALDCAITAYVGLHASEPGFRIMSFVDRERTSFGDDVDGGFFATRLARVLAEEFGLPGGHDLIFRLEVALEMADGIITRAFFSDPQGDERFIDECRRVVHDYMVGYYGPSASLSAPKPAASDHSPLAILTD